MEESYTTRLKELMATSQLSSFRALAQQAKVSEWTLRQLRRGAIANIRLGDLLKLSQTLGLSLETLVAEFSGQSPAIAADAANIAAVQQEYQRLQQQLEQQRQTLEAEFQARTLNAIESWLLQWPTAAHAAANNPAVPAARLLPLMRPLTALLEQWEVVAIAAVGAEVPYDPQQHQLMEGTARPGDLVRVRYVGYRQNDRLLYRAKVSPVVA